MSERDFEAEEDSNNRFWQEANHQESVRQEFISRIADLERELAEAKAEVEDWKESFAICGHDWKKAHEWLLERDRLRKALEDASSHIAWSMGALSNERFNGSPRHEGMKQTLKDISALASAEKGKAV